MRTTKHTFNYTGRVRLRRSAISLVVCEGPPRTFSAKWDLSGQPLPSDARVYIEATSRGSSTQRRFRGGTVADPECPTNAELGELGGDAPVFTLLVVDERGETGRILARADRLIPERPDLQDDDLHRASLLPVNYRDLGERVWQVNFDNAQPWLEVSDKIPDATAARRMVREDASFGATVFPEVVERVLEHVLIAHNHVTPSNDDADWKDLWLRLGMHWNPDPVPVVVDNIATPEEADELRGWARDAANQFCQRKGWRDKFVSVIEGEGPE